MKKLFVLFLFFWVEGKAQLPVPVGKADVGSLIGQLVNGIKPASFLSSFAGEKDNFLGSIGKIASAPDLAKNIVSLGKYIKPSMFKEAFSLKNLEKTASTVKTLGQASGLLKKLEGGLKPEAFTSDWASLRPAWSKALGMVK